MRAALWLLALFGVAVAAALFAGNNQGTVTLYWPPYRIDLSLNLVVLLLVMLLLLAWQLHQQYRQRQALPQQARLHLAAMDQAKFGIGKGSRSPQGRVRPLSGRQIVAKGCAQGAHRSLIEIFELV
mgnify:CR=1 FL=1